MGSTNATPRALELGLLLQRFRKRAGLSLQGLAAQVSRHHSELSRIERAQRGLDEVLLGSLLGALSVTAEERDEALALFRDATDPNWITSGPSKQLAILRSYEDDAAEIFTWQPGLIPGPLQTRQFAEAVMLSYGRSRTDAAEGADFRMARAARILAGDVGYTAIVSEYALRYPPCDAETAAAQLAYLREVSELGHVTVRAVPLDTKLLLTRFGPFVLIESRSGATVVHLEQPAGSTTMTGAKDVRGYKLAADALRSVAMSPEATSELIGEITDGMEHTDGRGSLVEVELQRGQDR